MLWLGSLPFVLEGLGCPGTLSALAVEAGQMVKGVAQVAVHLEHLGQGSGLDPSHMQPTQWQVMSRIKTRRHTPG